MSFTRNILFEREWIYKRLDPMRHGVSDEFFEGLQTFFNYTQSEQSYIERKNMLCLCAKYKNRERWDAATVAHHLYTKGFADNYYLWTSYGEIFGGEASTSGAQPEDAKRCVCAHGR